MSSLWCELAMQNQEGSILLLLNIVCLSFWGDVAGALGTVQWKIRKEKLWLGREQSRQGRAKESLFEKRFLHALVKTPFIGKLILRSGTLRDCRIANLAWI